MEDRQRQKIVRILGLGLDNHDRHIRITRGENFDVYFGSEQTHEQLQETCIKINEKLDRRGKKLDELSRDEFIDLVSDVDGS